MWSLTRIVRRVGVFGLVFGALLGFQAGPALATGAVPVLDPTANYRWMDGNGVAFSDEALPVQHWFSLRCNVANMGWPNRLVITWKDRVGNSYRFELKTLTESSCIYQSPPSLMCDQLVFDCFDTIFGNARGSLTSRGPLDQILPGLPNCDNCGYVEFRFTDNGPAKTGDPLQTPPYDGGTFTVTDLTLGVGILAACSDCPMGKADYRAHQRGTCPQS
jgi:hypothetical protein